MMRRLETRGRTTGLALSNSGYYTMGVPPDRNRVLVLVAVASCIQCSCGLVIAGVTVRRVKSKAGDLPWVYEADWEATAAARQDEAQQPLQQQQEHDPLASCFWPAASPLATLVVQLADAQVFKKGWIFLELGAGTGLLSLTAAARCGASKVIATDVSSTALEFCAAAADAQHLSPPLLETRTFDVLSAEPLPSGSSTIDVLLLSDLFVTEELARAHAARVAEAAQSSGRPFVLVVDPGRSTRACFLDALDRHGVAHGGFCSAEECVARARRGERLLFLDTEEGAPVSYEI